MQLVREVSLSVYQDPKLKQFLTLRINRQNFMYFVFVCQLLRCVCNSFTGHPIFTVVDRKENFIRYDTLFTRKRARNKKRWRKNILTHHYTDKLCSAHPRVCIPSDTWTSRSVPSGLPRLFHSKVPSVVKSWDNGCLKTRKQISLQDHIYSPARETFLVTRIIFPTQTNTSVVIYRVIQNWWRIFYRVIILEKKLSFAPMLYKLPFISANNVKSCFEPLSMSLVVYIRKVSAYYTYSANNKFRREGWPNRNNFA